MRVFSDCYTLWWMVELPLLALVFYSFPWSRRVIASFGRAKPPPVTAGVSDSVQREVKRGNLSLSYLNAFYGASSIVLFWIPLETAGSYRIIFSILNLVAVLYLCFYSDWSRNQIIRLISIVQEKPERS